MKLNRLLFICSVAISFQSQARTFEDVYFENFNESYTEIVNKKDFYPTEEIKNFWQRTENPEQLRCQKFLTPVQSKNKISIGYYIGYDNSNRDAVMDIYERKAFMAFLLSPCSGVKAVCGFLPKPGQQNLFYKNFKNLSGQTVQLEILLQDSSITPSNKDNINNRDQYVKSDAARRAFMQGLIERDIIIYSGHSRYGGGPDFHPKPFASDESERTEVEYYRRQRRGYQDMLTSLTERQQSGVRPPMMMMLNSCDSKLHFSAMLNKKSYSPEITFLTKRDITYREAIPQVLGLMRSILTQTCPHNFESFYKIHSMGHNPL